jgi:hypothetical protein
MTELDRVVVAGFDGYADAPAVLDTVIAGCGRTRSYRRPDLSGHIGDLAADLLPAA